MTELEKLRDRCKRQAREIRTAQVGAERRNRQLNTLKQIWCTGSCGTQWSDEPRVTQEIATEAELYFLRFATKALNHGCSFDAKKATHIWLMMAWPKRHGWLRTLVTFAVEVARQGWRYSSWRTRKNVLTWHLWRKRRG